MTRLDITTFLGDAPWHEFGGWDAPTLLAEMARHQILESWVSFLPALYWRDPAAGNTLLAGALAEHRALRPVPAVHPGLPDWEQALEEAVALRAPCIRCDPTWYGLDPHGAPIARLLAAAADLGFPVMMAVRLEDIRQRHPHDTVPELAPWMVRAMIRRHPRARIIVTHADREFIEQVHFGATPEEAARLLWDITWIWGPPEDHLATLLRTVGPRRFAFGTGAPLRLSEASIAKLDLLDLDPETRAGIDAGNAREFVTTR